MTKSIIELKNFGVSVKETQKQLVSGIHLDICLGEIFGLLGPSGAGKTTLVKAIALLAFKNIINGTYMYNDIQVYPIVNGNQVKEIRKDIIFIHQHPVLFSGSVRFNIEYGLRIRKKKHYQQDLDELIESFKMGELLDRDVRFLSAGEKQRVCLLRAMSVKPRVLILDEPTQNLDPGNIKNIEVNIKRFREVEGGTVIIVTHNFFQAQRIADRTAIMINGKVIEVNETENLFDSPEKTITADFLSGKMIY
ncbi:MAG: ABC transporter ATP-binding protein [Candidatus Hodarchaeales archaeon]